MKSVHKCWNRREEDTCVNLFRMTNEDTPGNQVEWVVENGKIYNNIFTFEDDAPRGMTYIEKNYKIFSLYCPN